jgi:hypothetical protein
MNRETVIPIGNRIGGVTKRRRSFATTFGRIQRLGDCRDVRALGSVWTGIVRALGSVLSESFVLWVPKGVVGAGNDYGTRQVKINDLNLNALKG